MYESREKLSQDPEEQMNVTQMQAFKTENIERYIAEQLQEVNPPDQYEEDDVQNVKGLLIFFFTFLNCQNKKKKYFRNRRNLFK